MKGEITMVALYVDLIKKGLKTIDQVPVRWREAVRQALANDPEYNPGE